MAHYGCSSAYSHRSKILHNTQQKPVDLQDLKPLFSNDPSGPKFGSKWSCVKDSEGKYIPCTLKVKHFLGKGTYAIVWVIQRDDLGEKGPLEFVAKVIDKLRGPHMNLARTATEIKEVEELTIREVRLLADLKHKHIIRCYGAFVNNESWVTILEYAKGKDLYQRLLKMKYFSEWVAANYLRQMFDAVAYLHSKNIMHRDIKPQNFLIKGEWNNNNYTEDRLLLSDFGFEQRVGQQKCGTANFAAPELFRLPSDELYYGDSVDIWSLGANAYVLLTGQFIYGNDGCLVPDTARTITNDVIKWQLDQNFVNKRAQEVLLSCLNVDPIKRRSVSAKDLLGHQWFRCCDDKHLDHNAMKKWKAGLIALRAINPVAENLQKKKISGNIHNQSTSISSPKNLDQKQDKP